MTGQTHAAREQEYKMLNFMKARPAADRPASLSAAEAVKLSAQGELTVIDVRDINEVSRSGKAVGALHIPLMMLRFQADPRNPDFHPKLNVDAPVAIYCASGARSQMATGMMKQLGFKTVHNIGGLGHWVSAGGKIEH